MESVSSEHRLEALLTRRPNRHELLSNSVGGVEVPISNGGGAVPGDVDSVGRSVILGVRVDRRNGVGRRRLPLEGESAVVHNRTGLCHVCKSGEEDGLAVVVVIQRVLGYGADAAPAVEDVVIG